MSRFYRKNFRTVMGRARDVSRELAHVKGQVVALALPEDEDVEVIDRASTRLVQFLKQERVKRRAQPRYYRIPKTIRVDVSPQKSAEQQIASRLVKQNRAKADTVLRQAKMRYKAQQMIFESSTWLTAAEIAQCAGFSLQNTSAQPNKWKRELKIFAVSLSGVDYYLADLLDDDNGYRPLAGVKPVLEIFKGKRDAWDIAGWFVAVNGFLGGEPPIDLIKDDPDRVRLAAEDEVMEIEHG